MGSDLDRLLRLVERGPGSVHHLRRPAHQLHGGVGRAPTTAGGSEGSRREVCADEAAAATEPAGVTFSTSSYQRGVHGAEARRARATKARKSDERRAAGRRTTRTGARSPDCRHRRAVDALGPPRRRRRMFAETLGDHALVEYLGARFARHIDRDREPARQRALHLIDQLRLHVATHNDDQQ